MKLELYKPRGYVPGTSGWLSIDSGTVYVWDKSTKDGLVPLAEPGGGVAVTWTGEDPIEWWVESLDTSTAVRDIQLTLSYAGATDVVKATGVWVTLTATAHDLATKEQILAAFPDITSQPPTSSIKGWLDYYGGVGMRPFRAGIRNGQPRVDASNVILFQWTAAPSGLLDEPVNIDVARRVDSRAWIKFSDGQIVNDYEDPTLDEVVYDKANDDNEQDDESAWDVTASDHIYSLDGPGYLGPPIVNGDLFAQRANLSEYVRIDFDDKKPQGNGVSGSRASAFRTWHVAHRWYIHSSDDWTRTTGDDPEVEGVNSIGPGHITIGEAP